MMAEVTTALAAVGIAICSCVVSDYENLMSHLVIILLKYMTYMTFLFSMARLRLIEEGEWL